MIHIDDFTLKNLTPDLYFEEQRTAEAVVTVINKLVVEGKKIDWECEIVEVMSHEEAFNQFNMIAEGEE